MKETSTELRTEQSFSVEPDSVSRDDFELNRTIPVELSFLDVLSRNFYWSWNDPCSRLFQEIDAELWDQCEQNPRAFLANVREVRLLQKASDDEYLARLRESEYRLNEYLSERSRAFGAITAENPVAYFCAEFGVHNSLPIYSGGLGILAGDHLKSASDLRVPLVAVGMFYRYGYFRQSLAHDGWQEESYKDTTESYPALEPVFDGEGNRVRIMIHMRGREVYAKAWLARVGRIALYLLDTNVPENDSVDRLVTGHLYGGDSETRIVQEKLLGIGGVRLLRALDIEPSVFHLNEGHSAFLTLELAREHLKANPELTFLDAIPHVRKQCVFTTHTPVDAGNDSFDPELIEECFDTGFIDELGISGEELFELGRTDPDEQKEWFGMTPLAIRMARSSNGVSEKHGEVSRKLWQKMFPADTAVESVPISHITNGVHPTTWIGPSIKNLYDREIGTDWREKISDAESWKASVFQISDSEVWNAHRHAKQLLIAYIRERTLKDDTGDKSTISEHLETRGLFDPNVLTIGFARRIAAYKRWNLLMTDLERLLKLVDSEDRPVQFVFAGKAHPQDRNAKAILQELMTINHNSNWQKRAVFVEDYDQEVARYLVRGVDVWMNVPRRPLEASGTSGQKVAMNGGLNFSVLDGWWIEGFDGTNGFAVGPAEDPEGATQDELDSADANSLYEVLENEIVPLYYQRSADGVPSEWIQMMKHSMAGLTTNFSSDRMLLDYINKIYTP